MEDGLTVTEYIKKAFDCKASCNYKQAIEFFYKALTLDNESSEIMNEIAGLYFKINNTDRAIEYYEQALLSDPFNADIKYNLALIYKYIGNMDKSISLLESIYNKNPKLEYIIDLIHSLYLEGKYEETISVYNKSQYVNAHSDVLHYYVGLANFSLGNLDLAEELFRKSLQYNLNNNDVKFSLAEILFEKKEYDEAEKLLLSILDSKICAKSYYLVGAINFARNSLDKAISYFSIASNIDFKNPVYFYELATVYSLKGFLTEAEENYQKAIKLSPNNLLYNYTLAYLYYHQGEISKTKQKLSYILSINPHHIDSLVLKALMASDEDDVMTANKIIDEVLESTSTNDFAFYVKSILYKKLSWWEKAIESIEKAIALKPSSLEYLSELAVYYYEAKFYGDTKKVCKKIIEIDNKYLFAYILLGKVYVVTKDYKSALKYLDTAIEYDKNSHEAYYLKAIVLKESELKGTAIDNAKIAVAISPDKVEYYEFIAQCNYEFRNYKDAYFYYKEASDIDILNVDYKYHMAKCSQMLNDVNNAITYFSVAKRLEPSNIFVAKEYADFLCSINRHKKALDVLKSALNYNPASKEKSDIISKISEIEKVLSDKSNSLQKWLMKFKKKN